MNDNRCDLKLIGKALMYDGCLWGNLNRLGGQQKNVKDFHDTQMILRDVKIQSLAETLTGNDEILKELLYLIGKDRILKLLGFNVLVSKANRDHRMILDIPPED